MSSPTTCCSSASTAELVGLIQGTPPEHDARRCWAPASGRRLRLAEFASYFRRIRAHFVDRARAGSRRDLSAAGRALQAVPLGRPLRRAARGDDHLSLVAQHAPRPDRRARGEPASHGRRAWPERAPTATGRGIGEADLRAAAPAGAAPGRRARDRRARYELLDRPSATAAGFALLPDPSRATCSSTSRATRSTRTGSSTSGASPSVEAARSASRPSGAGTAPRRSARSRSSSTW